LQFIRTIAHRLPKSDQREEAIKLMIEIFALPAVAARGAGKRRDASALAGA
jgi:hypothetical protein